MLALNRFYQTWSPSNSSLPKLTDVFVTVPDPLRLSRYDRTATIIGRNQPSTYLRLRTSSLLLQRPQFRPLQNATNPINSLHYSLNQPPSIAQSPRPQPPRILVVRPLSNRIRSNRNRKRSVASAQASLRSNALTNIGSFCYDVVRGCPGQQRCLLVKQPMQQKKLLPLPENWFSKQLETFRMSRFGIIGLLMIWSGLMSRNII